MIANYWFIGN